VTNITGPLYHLIRGDKGARDETMNLMFALLRTATVVAFLSSAIPFMHIFGKYDNGGFYFMAQFLIHPYAAALLSAFTTGGHLFIAKVMDIFMQRQLIFTPDDVGDLAAAIAFCNIAQLINHSNDRGFLDRKYLLWSDAFATWLYPQPKRYPVTQQEVMLEHD